MGGERAACLCALPRGTNDYLGARFVKNQTAPRITITVPSTRTQSNARKNSVRKSSICSPLSVKEWQNYQQDQYPDNNCCRRHPDPPPQEADESIHRIHLNTSIFMGTRLPHGGDVILARPCSVSQNTCVSLSLMKRDIFSKVDVRVKPVGRCISKKREPGSSATRLNVSRRAHRRR